MSSYDEGVRPGGAPPPPKPTPNPGPPKALSLDSPAKLARAAHLFSVALARQGLTYPDLQAPELAEHARAA